MNAMLILLFSFVALSSAGPYAFDGCTNALQPDPEAAAGENWREGENQPGFYDPATEAGEITCCALDGSQCFRKKGRTCRSGHDDAFKVTFQEAKEHCEADGLRLCASQAELDTCCGGGCQYDNQLVWGDLKGPYAFDGCTNAKQPDPEKAAGENWREGDNKPGVYGAAMEAGEITCCAMDGSKCSRKRGRTCRSGHDDAFKVTWHEAKVHCEADGMRLCASQEELDMCCGTGCQYDNQLVWGDVM